MTFRKIFLSAVFLVTLGTLTHQPAAAELSDDAKLERCNLNILRIMKHQKRIAELKKLMAYTDFDASKAHSDLKRINDVLANPQKLRSFAEELLGYDAAYGKPYGTMALEWANRYDLIWLQDYDEWTSMPGEVSMETWKRYMESFKEFLKNLKAAIEKKIPDITVALLNKEEYEKELNELENQLAYSRGALEEYKCRDLMKIEDSAPLGEMVEQGALGTVEADPHVWGLVEVVSDPYKQTEGYLYMRTAWPNAVHVETFEAGHFMMDHQDWIENERKTLHQSYQINVYSQAPPAQIKPGQNFELKVTGTCEKVKMDDWVKRWTFYEVGGGIAVKLSEFTSDSKLKPPAPYVGKGDDNEGGFIGSAEATYEFIVPPEDQISSEFTIEQKGLGIFKYKKVVRPIPPPQLKRPPEVVEEPKRDFPRVNMD